jgi:hypothetical protein
VRITALNQLCKAAIRLPTQSQSPAGNIYDPESGLVALPSFWKIPAILKPTSGHPLPLPAAAENCCEACRNKPTQM